MTTKHLGHVCGERAVDKNRDPGKSTIVEQFVEKVYQLLRPTDRKGGDDDFSAALDRAFHDIEQFGLHVEDRIVEFVPICRFGDVRITRVEQIGIPDHGQIFSAEIARECDPER